MKLYPAIDLHEGRCVRLYQGDYNAVTDYGNPYDVAKYWKSKGATFMHLVDLDGAKDGHFVNLDAVKAILSTGLKAELGGGIRNIDQIEELLSIGLDRVILGSSALNLDFISECINKFGPDKIVIGIDCKGFKIATHGWLNTTDIDAVEWSLKLKAIGVRNIIFTDISKDGTLNGINAEQTLRLVKETGLNIIASGGAKTIEDIKIAKEIGCSGIILGKSIYTGSIDLTEAIEKYED